MKKLLIAARQDAGKTRYTISSQLKQHKNNSEQSCRDQYMYFTVLTFLNFTFVDPT